MNTEIKIIITPIGWQVERRHGKDYEMQARDFGTSKKPGLMGKMLYNNVLSILDYLHCDMDAKRIKPDENDIPASSCVTGDIYND